MLGPLSTLHVDEPAGAVLGCLLMLAGALGGAVREQAALGGASEVGLLSELDSLVVRV